MRSQAAELLAEPDEDEVEDDDEDVEDDGFESDVFESDDFASDEAEPEDFDAGLLLDEEPRLSLR